MTRFRTWLAAAETQKSINGWLAWAWFAFTVSGVIAYAGGWGLGWMAKSIPVLFFMSGYANVAGHWSGWQGGRTEVKQETTRRSSAAEQLPSKEMAEGPSPSVEATSG